MKPTKKLNKGGKFEFHNPRIYVLCGLEFVDENTVLFESKYYIDKEMKNGNKNIQCPKC